MLVEGAGLSAGIGVVTGISVKCVDEPLGVLRDDDRAVPGLPVVLGPIVVPGVLVGTLVHLELVVLEAQECHLPGQG